MSKFYSILLDDEMHDDLKKIAYESGVHISSLVREAVTSFLDSRQGKAQAAQAQEAVCPQK